MLLIGYFVFLCRSSLTVHFAPDDPMNMAAAFRIPPWELALSPLILWKPLYRPLAGWLFVPLLRLFGLNPLPFHAVMLALVLVNVFLVYRSAKLLGACERAAWTVALIFCYHAGLKDLYYNTAFIYDALCGSLYLGALLYYVSTRRRGVLTWYQTVLFLGLQLLALSAKEMALTLPAALLAYELIYEKPVNWYPRRLAVWIRGPGCCILAGGIVDLVYLRGRLFGDGGLGRSAAYRPALSLERALDFWIRAFGDLFEEWQGIRLTEVIVIWAALFYLAWRRPRPVLRFAFLFLLLTPAPIEFLTGRAGACLYIPMFGWAVFLSTVFIDLADALANLLSREPLLRLLQPRYLSVPLMAAGLFFWVHQNLEFKRSFIDPTTANLAPKTWKAIQQMKELNPHVGHHRTVVFLNDPFGTYDMSFIAELFFRDPTVTIRLNSQTPLAPEEVASAALVFDYKDGNLVQLR